MNISAPKSRREVKISGTRNYTVDANGCVNFITSLKDLFNGLCHADDSKSESTDAISHQIYNSSSHNFEVQVNNNITE